MLHPQPTPTPSAQASATAPLRSASPNQPAAYQLSKVCATCPTPSPLIRIEGAIVCACRMCGRVYSYPALEPLFSI
jgi:hypothetical protein